MKKKIPLWFSKNKPPKKPEPPERPLPTITSEELISEYNMLSGDNSLEGLYNWLSIHKDKPRNGCISLDFDGHISFSVFGPKTKPNPLFKKQIENYEKKLIPFHRKMITWENKMADWNAIKRNLLKNEGKDDIEISEILQKFRK